MKDQIEKSIEWELNRFSRYTGFVCLLSVVLFWDFQNKGYFSILNSLLFSVGLSFLTAAVFFLIFTSKKKIEFIKNLIRTKYNAEKSAVDALEVCGNDFEFSKIAIDLSETEMKIIDDNQSILIAKDNYVVKKYKYYETSCYYLIEIVSLNRIFLTCADLSNFKL